MLLLEFVCSFAWADLDVHPKEREFVSKLVRRLELDDDERRQVESWLIKPPPPESVDPTRVPRKHREEFIRAIETLVAVDGEIASFEKEQLLLFEQLLR